MAEDSVSTLEYKVESSIPAHGVSTSLLETPNERSNLINNLNPFPVLQFDRKGQITDANPVAKTVFSLTANTQITELIPTFSPTELELCIQNNSIITKICAINSNTYQFVARGAGIGNCGLLYGVDISDRIAAEKKLERGHAFLRKVIDTNPNLIFVKNSNGEFVLANQTVADVYGTTIEDIVGKTDNDFNSESDEVEAFRRDDYAVLHHQKDLVINEEKVTDSDGNVRWLQTVKRPIQFFDNETHVLGVATDISKLRQLQSQLLHSQKMEALGQLAGGIAHDFNNILTAILGSTTLLLENETSNQDIKHLGRLIETAATQASQLTQKLLGFAREGKHQNVPVDTHQLIGELSQLLMRTMEENISIDLNLSSRGGYVLGDPVQLQQVFLNLAINARDAITSTGTRGGDIAISSEDYVCNETTASEVALSPGSYLKIAITDTGCGIPPDNIDRIFEPFFTTKDPAKGTGMGLAMVYGIVENHSGAITVKSVVGKGSIFSVYLPSTVQDDHDSKADGCDLKAHKGNGTVLLVDDHHMIRDVTTQMLEKIGYTVLTACDGMEAIEVYRANQASIDVVIMDMVMPKLGAQACFKALQEMDPGVQVILSTGYINHASIQDLLEAGMVGFVQKPYQLHQLAQAVSSVILGEGKRNLLS